MLPDTVDKAAQAFLTQAQGQSFTNSFGQKQTLFSTQDGQFTAAQNGLFDVDRSFVQKYVTPYANRAALEGVQTEIGQLTHAAASAIQNDPIGIGKQVGTSLLKSAWGAVTHPISTTNDIIEGVASGAKNFGEGIAASTSKDVQRQVNSIYGQDVTGAVQIATSAQGALLLSSALGAGKAASKVGSATANAVGTVSKVTSTSAKLGAADAALAHTLVDTGIGAATRNRILDIPKGARPEPSSYIPDDAIKAHLEKFDDGASYLVPKATLDKWGRDILGYGDNTQFVMTKGEMDRVLAAAKGDISIVEAQLGIPPGSWVGKEMVRIDIPEPAKLGIRLPSGNEAGANIEWLPGGKLPTGLLEAVVDSIPKGKYKEVSLWH